MAAVSRTPNLKTSSQQRPYTNPTRRPLTPSVERENGNVTAARRSRPRDVASRYLSTSTSSSSSSNSASSASTLSNSSCLPSLRRCPSPIVSRLSTSEAAAAASTPALRPSVTRRAQSVERRRVPTPRPNIAIGTELSTSAAKQLLTSSKRSLSVSFQGESYSMPFSKTKPPPVAASTPNLRKTTPERKRPSSPMVTRAQPRREGDHHRENARPGLEQQLQHPWPARSRQMNISSSVQPLSKSVDLSAERRKLMSGSGKVVRALQKSLTTEGCIGTYSSDELIQQLQSSNERSNATGDDTATTTSARSLSRLVSTSDSMPSDSESVCSDSNSGLKIGGAATRGIVVPARYLQDRRPSSSSLLTRSNSMGRIVPSSKLPVPKKLMCNSPSSSPKGAVLSRGLSPIRGGVRPASPIRAGVRPASPSRLSAATPLPLDRPSSSRGMASPSRIRNSAAAGVCVNSNASSKPSVLSFPADIKRVTKVGDNRMSDAHWLRVLHNRHLQWRFINARAEDVLSVQKYNAEMILFSTWKATSDLCSIVLNKRLELARLRLKLKLTSLLNEQMPYLEDWAVIDKDHSDSLVGAIESLEASTLRLPVVCGARTDIQSLKDAICSAVDVLHAMAYSICSLLINVEEVKRLVTEVASLSSSEHALLNECKDILSALAAMQVKDVSLRTHVLQLKRKTSSSSFAVEA